MQEAGLEPPAACDFTMAMAPPDQGQASDHLGFPVFSRDEAASGSIIPCFVYPPRTLNGVITMHSCGDRAVKRSGKPSYSLNPGCAFSATGRIPTAGLHLRAARSLGVPMGLIIGGSDVLLIDKHPARDRFLEVLHEADRLMPVSQDLSRSSRQASESIGSRYG